MTARPKRRAKPKPAAASASQDKLVVDLDQMDDKKRSVRYFCDVPDGEPYDFDNIYIKKSGLAKIGDPKRIRVTVEALPDEE
jgi:hypothetical protein